VEEILDETCTRTFHGSNDDDADNESCDLEPEIARKINKTVCHLSSDSESGSAKQQDSSDKNDIYAAAGDCNMARTRHYSKSKIFLEEIQG
jgi:hypothetical protein